MTIEADLQRAVDVIERAAKTLDTCGAEAVGILRALDENGEIPESVRGQVLDVLTRWRSAVSESRAAMRLQC